MTNFPALLGALASAGVEYIVVGGAAATAHGSARLTLDLDVVYRRTPDNVARVVESIAGHHPRASQLSPWVGTCQVHPSRPFLALIIVTCGDWPVR